MAQPKGLRILNIFVTICLKSIFYLTIVGIILWAFPAFHRTKGNTSIGERAQKLYAPVFAWIGLWQGWSMFAANPSHQNSTIQVAIEFYDGSFEFIDFPRPHESGLWKSYKLDRYRKFIENLPLENHSAIWDQVAEHFRIKFEPKRVVKRIDLIHKWSLVPDANQKNPPPERAKSTQYSESKIFHTAKYDPL